MPRATIFFFVLLAGCGLGRDASAPPRLLPLEDLAPQPSPAATQAAADALAARGADLRVRAAP